MNRESARRWGSHLDSYLRLGSARATRQIALRRGASLGMVVGCGYPKSGTVWLCRMLSVMLGLPHPTEYRTPVAMPAIVHAHWPFDERVPPTVYVRRDGRDVMVSLYFHTVRMMQGSNARSARLHRADFTHLYGPGVDLADVRANLPRFIEHRLTRARGDGGASWAEHVLGWWGHRDHPSVAHVSYEGLSRDPAAELVAAATRLGLRADPELADLAARRWSMAADTGRSRGEEDATAFVRKGIAGDWRNHFTQDAGEVFDAIAGEALVELGYADSRDWSRGL